MDSLRKKINRENGCQNLDLSRNQNRNVEKPKFIQPNTEKMHSRKNVDRFTAFYDSGPSGNKDMFPTNFRPDASENQDNFIKKFGAIISISSFVLMIVFAGVWGYYGYKNRANTDLEKQLSRSKSEIEEASGAGLRSTVQPANNTTASTAKTTASQQNNVSANQENINPGPTNPPEDEASTEKKKYSDTKEGISFEYPADYTIEDVNGQITATKTDAMWRMKVYDNKDKKEIQDWLSSYFTGKNNTDCQTTDPATLKIGTFTTKQEKSSTTDGKCDGVGFYALNSDKTKIVRIRLDKADETEANKILGTFKFEK